MKIYYKILAASALELKFNVRYEKISVLIFVPLGKEKMKMNKM